jgi:hypothetical protein
MSYVRHMSFSDYRLQNVIDGLSAIAASPEDKQLINYNFVLTIDEVFDTEPLDWLRSLVNDGVLSEQFADEVKSLYQEINEFTKTMSIEQEDEFIKSNAHPLPAWSIRALELLASIQQEPNFSFKRDALKRAP